MRSFLKSSYLAATPNYEDISLPLSLMKLETGGETRLTGSQAFPGLHTDISGFRNVYGYF